ncbi:MAG TPA: kelch repeat-containing protein [Polyangiaceae bacterium]|nr:kelch repeat-containing protein [Polyangiaceae bacterium]
MVRRAALLSFVGFSAAILVAACGSGGSGFGDGGTDGGGDGSLSCSGSQQSCGGKCVDTSSDLNNCGSCGNTCAGGDLCCAGKCVKSTGCDFAVTSINPVRGNQSGGDYITLTGAGFTPDMAVFIGDGRAPTLVLDGNHARIQTPPGPVGTYDITLVSTKGTSLTRSIFQYVAAGMALPWQKKPMASVRGEHPGVTVLQDGRVLIAGGTTVPDSAVDCLATAEIFQRGQTDTVTPAANTMAVPRWHDAAVTMLDGRVLVEGGAVCTGTACKTADLFDPTTNMFKPTANLMSEDRTSTWAVLMVDGRVMITSAQSATVEIYDPTADSFSTVALNTIHYFGQRIVRMRDGRVMVMGGDGCQGQSTCGPAQTVAEIFDPKTNKFTLAKPMNQGRSQFTAHVLPDGRVMVFGGASSSAGGVNAPMDSIEAYDPKADTWTVMPYKLTVGRTWHASALVRDGTIIVMGGYTTVSCTPSDSVDQVDPIAGTVTPFGTLPDPNTEWNAITMLDGSVIGVGGGACGGNALPDLDFLPGVPIPN